MSQRDPRDGTSPPAPLTDSPANPIAIAALLSGNPNPTAEQLAVILGAPLSVLLRNKNSILYAKGKKSAGAVDKFGAVTAAKAASARPGEVVAFKPTRPSPPVQSSSKGKSPPASTQFRVEPFLDALMAGGVGCSQWLTMSAGARLNTVRNFFYQLSLASAANAPPSDPLVLVAAIDGACRVTREVTPLTSDVRDRLRAIANDCEALAREDRGQQINAIRQAFLELSQDQFAMLRLALARYDVCHPASSGVLGWHGYESPLIRNPVSMIRARQGSGYLDVLDGDVSGMSWAQWVKQGDYMPATGPSVLDPIQGALGDCWLISALSAVAWVASSRIDAFGQDMGNGRRRFRFGSDFVEVSDRTPCVILQDYMSIFCKSFRINAQWPAVMEKAFAVINTGNRSDYPQYDLIAGDGSRTTRTALLEILGGSYFGYFPRTGTADQMFDVLRNYCDSTGRARFAMTAGTLNEDRIQHEIRGLFDRTGIVPEHAHTVLGCGVNYEGRKYVALRNPWGSSHAGIPNEPYRVTVPGLWLRQMNLDGYGGCFALSHTTFHQAFDGFEGVR